MRISHILTSLAMAASIAAVAPAVSSGRPIDVPPATSHAQRCYQLNPVVPGEVRGRHRVVCGGTDTAPAAAARPPIVSDAHPAQSAGIPWDAIAFAVAALGLGLSTAAVAGRRRSHGRRVAA